MLDLVILDARDGICLNEPVLLDVDLVSMNLASESLLGLLGLEILHGFTLAFVDAPRSVLGVRLAGELVLNAFTRTLGHEEILAERDVGSSHDLVVDPLDITEIDIRANFATGRVSLEKLITSPSVENQRS